MLLDLLYPEALIIAFFWFQSIADILELFFGENFIRLISPDMLFYFLDAISVTMEVESVQRELPLLFFVVCNKRGYVSIIERHDEIVHVNVLYVSKREHRNYVVEVPDLLVVENKSVQTLCPPHTFCVFFPLLFLTVDFLVRFFMAFAAKRNEVIIVILPWLMPVYVAEMMYV